MRIVIAGGTGLIGTALSEELIKDGFEVIILTRNPAKYQQKQNIQYAQWDGVSVTDWAKYIDGAEAVVNLAGESIGGETFLDLFIKRWTPKRKLDLLNSRLDAGRAIAQAIYTATKKPKVLIQASAVGYYGDRGDEVLEDDASPANDFLASICTQWEDSTASVETLGVRRAIIRSAGVVMSTHGGSLPFMLLPFKFFAGGPISSGKQWFSWIHIADEVGAIRFLIENPQASGAFNLSAPQLLTNREFSRLIGRVMTRPAFIPIPAFALHLLIGEKVSILLASQRQVPARLQALGYTYRFSQAEDALRDLLN